MLEPRLILQTAADLEVATQRARAEIGERVDVMVPVVRQLALETPYSHAFWWPKMLERMRRGERARDAYDAEIIAMRQAHTLWGRYT